MEFCARYGRFVEIMIVYPHTCPGGMLPRKPFENVPFSEFWCIFLSNFVIKIFKHLHVFTENIDYSYTFAEGYLSLLQFL